MFHNQLLLLAGLVAFIIMLPSHVSCSSTILSYVISGKYSEAKPYRCANHSSCGNISRIAYPFRLEGDPPTCGEPNYQLSCENNQTMLTLKTGKFLVTAINYNNFTIRIADVGIRSDDPSSNPRHSLTSSAADLCGSYPPSIYCVPIYTITPTINHIVYVSCETPQKSPSYVDAAPCIGKTNSSERRRYCYVMVGDVQILELGALCSVDLVTMTTLHRQDYQKRNFSYMEIHKELVYGLMLSWDPIRCGHCYAACELRANTIVMHCSNFFPGIFGYDFKDIPGTLRYFGTTIRLVIAVTTLLVTFLVARALCGYPFLLAFLIYKWLRRPLSMDDSLEEFLQSQNNLMPIRYSYSDIKKMSKSFQEKLGEGGYGSVFKGKLKSGHLVAIKMLGKSKANGQEFINEVATIGRIHHVNVVRLVGFCAEGQKRALVYEFMPKGSLDRHIFSREGCNSLSWNQMYRISLGVARGIEYLHRGCNMQILHFDIKPHNILLDDNFFPKISDFGLAKLYPAGNSVVSITAARGTIGYIAPELIYKRIGRVSYKADVYSFGMLLLEMTGKRKKLNATRDDSSSKMYFPLCVYHEIVEEKDTELEEEEENVARKMIVVALWCIQVRPDDRPSMRKVIEMLEGGTESLELPPEPTFNIEEVPGDNEEAIDLASSSFASNGNLESVRLIINTESNK